MSLLGRYRQQPGDKRKRGIDYDDFLESDETLSEVSVEVTPETDPPFLIETVVIDPEEGKELAYFASGGIDGETYKAQFTITTTGGQTLEDEIEFDVEET